MQQLTTNQIRQYWIDFFQKRQHTEVDSSSLAPDNDPTLMFVNAGMVQFKDLFTGVEKRAYSRAVTAQKCLRVSGKHNDLEEVGPSPRHHTFFEMLGNFSFGDYFKKDAIDFAWTLLIEEWGLPLERMWFTVYEDDDEAERLWIERGAPAERVRRFGKKDNWWAMGDTGPCGPCSEIHYYWGDLEQQTPAGVNKDDEYLEIWNLVFMQFEQKADGTMINLPKPSVDTGAGLERLASILQGKDNNYDTDAFTPVMDRIQELLGHDNDQRAEALTAYRVIADHARAVTLLICDGILPRNEGRNYVPRMILRRAARFGKLIGFDKPFLADVADVVIQEMGSHYTDLPAKRDFILSTITAEEERFHRALDVGLQQLDGIVADLRSAGKKTISGADAFRLWDTYGFPVDLTRDVAKEHGLLVDEVAFQHLRQEARQQSRQEQVTVTGMDLGVYGELLHRLSAGNQLGPEGVESLIYANVDGVNTHVAGIIKDGRMVEEAVPGDEVEIVLPQTPFYVEKGGQVSDTGEIYYFPENMEEPVWTVEVVEMREPIANLITHVGRVTSGTVRTGDPAYAEIDGERRWDIMRNHTATHILHAQLRAVLGDHVHQAGSLVAPDRLRFDFIHPQALTQAEVTEIEARANEAILENLPVKTHWTSYNQAIAEGVTALFGEKYGDEVRVVSIGDRESSLSAELCGGMHVESSAEIGSFRIVNESSSAAGQRRMEVVTGRGAERLIKHRLETLARTAGLLRTQPDRVVAAVHNLTEQNQLLQREVTQLRQQLAQQETATLLDRAVTVGDASVLAVRVEATDVETMRQMTDWFRDKLGSGVVVLGAIIQDKPMLVAAATPDMLKRGIHAGNLVRDTAKIIGGGGGGRPDIAQAGGRDSSRLDEALATVVGWVQSHLQ